MKQKEARKAAVKYAIKAWWGKYTTLSHISQAFMAGVNYQKQISGNTQPSKQTEE